MAATWNPSDKGAKVGLSNGDLTCENITSTDWHSVRATESKSSGKWYWEIYIDYYDGYHYTGTGKSTANILYHPGYDANGYSYKTNGYKAHNSSEVAFGASYTTGDIIGVALDLDNGKIWFAKNNAWQASGDPANGTNEAYSGLSGAFFPMQCPRGYDAVHPTKNTGRFATGDLTYSPPSGFTYFDGTLGDTTDFFDGKISINSPTNLLDGKARVSDTATDLLDGKARVKNAATGLLDGKARIKDFVTKLLDGKAVLKDSTTNLLDGKVIIEGLNFNYLDGKIWIKEVVEGNIELPPLDILGNTGAVGDVTLPSFEVLGEGSIGVNAQGNITLPGLEVLGFTGAKGNYSLPSLGISGTSVVGIVGSGNVILPIFTIESQSFTDAIVNGDITLPFLRVNASSIHGSLCIGEVSLPLLSIAATAKVGVVCVGAVTLPCLIIEAKGGHIPTGDGDVVLPLLQIYSTASILADPRDGCHILRHHRWR